MQIHIQKIDIYIYIYLLPCRFIYIYIYVCQMYLCLWVACVLFGVEVRFHLFATSDLARVLRFMLPFGRLRHHQGNSASGNKRLPFQQTHRGNPNQEESLAAFASLHVKLPGKRASQPFKGTKNGTSTSICDSRLEKLHIPVVKSIS